MKRGKGKEEDEESEEIKGEKRIEKLKKKNAVAKVNINHFNWLLHLKFGETKFKNQLSLE